MVYAAPYQERKVEVIRLVYLPASYGAWDFWVTQAALQATISPRHSGQE